MDYTAAEIQDAIREVEGNYGIGKNDGVSKNPKLTLIVKMLRATLSACSTCGGDGKCQTCGGSGEPTTADCGFPHSKGAVCFGPGRC